MNRRDSALVLRGQIVHMWEGGSSIREISEHLGVARSTVWKWTRRWEESGDLTDLRK